MKLHVLKGKICECEDLGQFLCLQSGATAKLLEERGKPTTQLFDRMAHCKDTQDASFFTVFSFLTFLDEKKWREKKKLVSLKAEKVSLKFPFFKRMRFFFKTNGLSLFLLDSRKKLIFLVRLKLHIKISNFLSFSFLTWFDFVSGFFSNRMVFKEKQMKLIEEIFNFPSWHLVAQCAHQAL